MLDEAREAYHEALDNAVMLHEDPHDGLVAADRALFAAREKIGCSPELPPDEPRYIDVTLEDRIANIRALARTWKRLGRDLLVEAQNLTGYVSGLKAGAAQMCSDHAHQMREVFGWDEQSMDDDAPP